MGNSSSTQINNDVNKAFNNDINNAINTAINTSGNKLKNELNDKSDLIKNDMMKNFTSFQTDLYNKSDMIKNSITDRYNDTVKNVELLDNTIITTALKIKSDLNNQSKVSSKRYYRSK